MIAKDALRQAEVINEIVTDLAVRIAAVRSFMFGDFPIATGKTIEPETNSYFGHLCREQNCMQASLVDIGENLMSIEVGLGMRSTVSSDEGNCPEVKRSY